MTSFLIITHGNFGQALLDSCELITGKLDNYFALGLDKDDDIEKLKQIVEEKLTVLKKKGEVIVLVDILGGSPSNVANFLLKTLGGFRIITGVNLPLLIELSLSNEQQNEEELVTKAAHVSKDSIMVLQ